MPTAFLIPTAPRAAFLAALLFCAIAQGAEPAPTPEARAHFKAGVSHLDHERYPEAYREFKQAYEITPRWTVLGNLGIAADHLERDGEAIDVLQQYLERGRSELSARETRTFRSMIERLEKGIATVTLEAPGPFWIVDTRVDAGAPVVNEYGPFEGQAELRVRTGQHEFKLERSSIDAPSWSVKLLAGDGATHAFEREPEPPALVETFQSDPAPDRFVPESDSAPASRTASYVLWGTGAAGAIATTLILLESNRIQNDADDEFGRNCPLGLNDSDPCQPTTAGDRKAAHWRTGALVTGVGTLGALVGGTVLYVLDGRSGSGSGTTEASVQPWINPTGIGVSGTF